MEDAIGRRLRHARSRKKKAIEIGERDTEILRLLSRYRYLRKDFMFQLLSWPSEQTFTRRLRDLFDAGYINRPEEQWRTFNCRYSNAVYELDLRGEQYLRDHDLHPPSVSHLVRKSRSGAIRQYPHSMMICDTLASIEIGMQGTGCELVTWEEILTRQGTIEKENPFKLPCTIEFTYPKTRKTHRAKTFLIPDALFGIRHEGKVSFFALEAERGNGIWRSNLQQPSFLKKILGYRDIIRTKTYEKVYGIPNMRVLVVTGSPARIQTMINLTAEITGGSNLFLFHDIPTHDLKAPKPFPQLFEAEWKRAGRDSTTLSPT